MGGKGADLQVRNAEMGSLANHLLLETANLIENHSPCASID